MANLFGFPLPTLKLATLQLLIFSSNRATYSFEYAGYGHPCDKDIPCNPKKDLQCVPVLGTCQCSSELTFVSAYEGCLPEPKESNDWHCVRDSQCHISELGRHSYCDQNRCSCLQESIQGDRTKDVTRAQNFCYLVNTFGESCAVNAQCDASKNLECNNGSGTGQCGCAKKTHWEYFDPASKTQSCWNLKVPFPCQSSQECETVIGDLAVCDPSTRSCKCSDTSDDQVTGFYDGKCYYEKKLGDFCKNDQECQEGGLTDVWCDIPTKTCRQLGSTGNSASPKFPFFIPIFVTIILIHFLMHFGSLKQV